MSRLREECFISDDFDQARLTALITTGKVIMFVMDLDKRSGLSQSGAV